MRRKVTQPIFPQGELTYEYTRSPVNLALAEEGKSERRLVEYCSTPDKSKAAHYGQHSIVGRCGQK